MWGFLWAAVGPLAIRVLSVVGFSAVSFTGVLTVTNALVSQAQTSWGALPASVLALCALAGLPQCLGLVFGAFVARVTLWVGTSATKLIFKGGA